MRQQGTSERDRGCFEPGLPRAVGGDLVEPREGFAQEGVAEQVEYLSLVAHVPVERGRLHAESRRDGAEGDFVEPVGVRDRQGRIDDILPFQCHGRPWWKCCSNSVRF